MVIKGYLLSFPTQSLLCFLFCLSSKPLQISDLGEMNWPVMVMGNNRHSCTALSRTVP